MLPKVLTGASPKSYLNAKTAAQWLNVVRAGLEARTDGGHGVFLCAPYPLLTDAIRALGPTGALVGTQDVSRYPAGAYTGEVNAELLGGLGARFAMIGHPERVRYFGEEPADFAAKAAAASSAGLVPILIVGEPTRGADPEEIIKPQIDSAFADLSPEAPVVVAYEPTWAIGAAEPAPPAHIVEVVARVREILAARPGESRVLYGGSAGPGTYAAIAGHGHTAGQLAGIPDGVFLGRAGVDPHGFLATVDEVRGAQQN
ncbi:triose-phosphate isomerase family protein [Mycolicibacterium komossense]|uniref:Triosephosphate isomerase n=1 Tax=Mycolicibacterium komossense TaxID=1779 RepID=A0ABT3C6M8_9MYCO|nr:triose-phosphate isomerase family protein [Mycolicibacterium komossense]MCV7225122.1 triosephosphate isomerase [Mycolicibacterium komossense]